jgi:hypothetical protein
MSYRFVDNFGAAGSGWNFSGWIGNCNRTLDRPADEGLVRHQEKQK